MNTKYHQNPVGFASQTWKRHSVTQNAQILSDNGPWVKTLFIKRKTKIETVRQATTYLSTKILN